MRPLEVHLDNCNELIPDARRRILSSEARKFAEGGFPPRPGTRFKNYYSTHFWSAVIAMHEQIFWYDCYWKRKARLKRIAERNV